MHDAKLAELIPGIVETFLEKVRKNFEFLNNS